MFRYCIAPKNALFFRQPSGVELRPIFDKKQIAIGKWQLANPRIWELSAEHRRGRRCHMSIASLRPSPTTAEGGRPPQNAQNRRVPGTPAVPHEHRSPATLCRPNSKNEKTRLKLTAIEALKNGKNGVRPVGHRSVELGFDLCFQQSSRGGGVRG
jgi:hypothetical protein